MQIFEEKISTRKAATGRPGLVAALDYLRPGGTLCVWKLDRLGRSVKDVLIIADDLHERGIGLRILTGKLSGSYSPAARAGFLHDDWPPSPSWSATSSMSAPCGRAGRGAGAGAAPADGRP